MSKVITTQIDGCIWCPYHTTYENDVVGQGRCKKVMVRKNNYKLIRREEMRKEEHPQNPYYSFPSWCPLDEK